MRLVTLLSFSLFASFAQAVEIERVDRFKPVFMKNGHQSLVVRGGTTIDGTTFAVDTAVSLPTMTAGTDYRVYLDGGNLYAVDYNTAPSGPVVGGFHYLPSRYPTDYDFGGYVSGGPTILEYSIWDEDYRPSCPDPRGMTRPGNAPFWIDIYFAGDSYNVDGVSRNNEYILTGTNPPKRVNDYGGNGVAKYGSLNWWEANETVSQWGKRLPEYGEMTLAAFGARENIARGNHPIKTGWNTYNASTFAWDFYLTSKFGVNQAVGAVWIWTATLSDWQGTPATGPYGWDFYNVTGGRGQLILQNSDDLTALMFGGKSSYTSQSGTRMAETIEKLWDNSVNIAIRGACDHMWR